MSATEVLFSIKAYGVDSLIFALQQAKRKAEEAGTPLDFWNVNPLQPVEVDLIRDELGGKPHLSVSIFGFSG